MTPRTLPREEWARLVETPQLGPIWERLPADARVIVVEDAGRIVATWALVPMLHVEGLWIAPETPRAAVPLFRAAQDGAKAMGATWVWTCAADAAIEALIARRKGVPIAYPSFVFPLVKEER